MYYALLWELVIDICTMLCNGVQWLIHVVMEPCCCYIYHGLWWSALAELFYGTPKLPKCTVHNKLLAMEPCA
jgi:hypothetical protein